MVTYDKGERCTCNISGHVCQMVETFTSTRVCRRLVCREQRYDFISDQGSVDHDILCFSRMYINTFNMKCCTCCVEIFVGNFTFVIAIHCVSIICLKNVQVKQICSTTDFLVRRKTNPQITMWNVFCNYLFDCCENFCDAGFVIRTQKCSSVRCNKCAPLQRGKRWKIFYF